MVKQALTSYQAKEQIVGSTGFPAESHETVWLKLTVDQPHARCSMSRNGTSRRTLT